MPEKFGVYEGESDSQYVGCIVCSNAVDLFEPHSMFREDEVSELGDVSTRTYHFCSEDCLETWKRENQLRD